MKKTLLTLFALAIIQCCYAQKLEPEYYIYNIITLDGDLKNESLSVKLDDGEEIKKLKDEEGHTIKFKTPAGVIMYFESQGWELWYMDKSSRGIMINGGGSNFSTSHWIIRKQCSKEEFDNKVKKCIK